MEKNSPKIYRFKSLTSTNQELNDLNKSTSIPEFSVVVASEQTAGRGQMGNSWESEPGKNLTFSIIVRPSFLPIQQQFRITQVITLALMRLLKPLLKNVSIKWPNDIYCKDEKIAGILVENSLKGDKIEYSIIGVGLNVNQEIFCSGATNPTSLKQLTNQDFDIYELLNQLIVHFVEIYSDWMVSRNDEWLHNNYMENLYRKNGMHPFKDSHGEFFAKIKEIKPSGHIILQTKSGDLRTYAFKEISFETST
ncbi:MAG TPA: biotin--[acetyl-CoA-carboxylase] ligase [Marinilabiliaceae bacterium]|nr:biotin--[acetyl-CoA-carboxylase] ligase [Marinilabiliaceae bacterium]